MRSKFGNLWKQKADPTKMFLTTGQTKNKDPKFNYSVEITIKDAQGKVVQTLVNPIINLFEVSKETSEKVPNLLYDLTVGSKDEE